MTKATATCFLIFINSIFLFAQSSIPEGTKITLKMDNGISSKSAEAGDTFTAVTSKVVRTESGTLPKGLRIEGLIKRVTPAGSNERVGALEIEFTDVVFEQTKRSINAELVVPLVGKKRVNSRVISILGGTALGGVVGLLGGTRGALIGAGIGAGAGTGIAVSRKGREAGINTDEEFEIVLKKALKLPADGF